MSVRMAAVVPFLAAAYDNDIEQHSLPRFPFAKRLVLR
jgi:hypothetical protein